MLAGAVAAGGALAGRDTALANPYIVVDVKSGQVIEHSDAFRKWYPASLTKLMTAYLAFRALKAGRMTLETPVVMSQRAASAAPSKTFFRAGSQVTLDNALKLLIVKSANDIAIAIAEAVSGSQEAFIAAMNAEAARLGMTSTRFVNPNGLPGKGQYSTARDIALLAVAIKREFPQYSSYFSLEGVDTGKNSYGNYNMLIGRFSGADGMKTGFICASGFNQVSSATRNGRSVVSVVLGEDSLAARTERSAALLQKALTTAGSGVPLARLAPYGDYGADVADISAQICNPQAAKVRSEGRDEAGRMIIKSPYVREMERPPLYSFAGVIPGTEPSPPEPKKAGNAARVTLPAKVAVPVPRPVN
ncbi:D-alanyl-D-alanine carboxypeptidase [Rhizobiaceae bacterium BDR2-2]|uniref:D-alanyl-D-alanine carboxypeptidase n=1 Tax=Ectorhizobium quercum TaxID=2965071 RepID=A0AAE3SWJ4_9HYPH|nr:D-alanyl-D-alanine carboxypeptidase family protein [Ectorhizobium quercum]MCX8999217.1 D-alanyl-D-alanine carboxypeptidase [Ectorhizobium quercum]